MRPLTLAQIGQYTQGKAIGSGQVDHVVIDSRKAGPNSLFFALPGEHVDGHDFVCDVMAQGGCAVVKEGSHTGPGVVQVTDPLLALQSLAQAYLAEFPVPVVAVTGSNGKTSTKDMIPRWVPNMLSMPRGELSQRNRCSLTVWGCYQLLVVE